MNSSCSDFAYDLSVNMTCNDYESNRMSVHSMIMVIAELVFMVIICGGNLLTILAVWKTKKLQTIPNQYIVSLACADFLAGLVLPYQAAVHFPGIQAIFDRDKYLCLCRHAVFFVSFGQTIQCITVVAVDRAICIGFPFYYQTHSSLTKTRIIITCTWIFAVFLGTIPLYSNNWDSAYGCSLFRVIPMYYQVYIQTGIFTVFCAINAICYGYIFYIAKQHMNAINRQLSAIDATKHCNNIKAVKLFLTVFGIFIICMCPGFVATTLGHTIGLPNGIVDIAVLCALLNSGMNFFIYAARSRDFRKAFVRILCCRKTSVSPDVDTMCRGYFSREMSTCNK